MDIDANCPYLLFGETIWRKIQHPPPPLPEIIFYTNFFFNVGNSMKREENMKYWKQNYLIFFFNI